MNELTDRDESGLGWVYPPQPQQTFIQEVIGMISGIAELVEGQDYIDVLFGSAQPSANWVLLETSIFNTGDNTPLNVWPGVMTSKTTGGFRLQLNGIPDSGNYFLNWSIRGVFGYYLAGPFSGRINVASSPFTVRLPDESTLTGTVIITPTDGGVGGTFTPVTVALTVAAPVATFTYTPSTYGPRSVGTDNDRGLVDPAEIGFISVVSGYTLDGPSVGGGPGVPSTDFTVALPVGGAVFGSVIITPNDAGDGGTFTPTSVTLTTLAPSATFIYTPASRGTKTISTTNNGGLTDPAGLGYEAGLVDDAPVGTWIDSSGNGHTAAQTGSARPTYKVNIVNGKPVVRFVSANLNGLLLSSPISGANPITSIAVMKITAGDTLFTLASTAGNLPAGVFISGGNIFVEDRAGYIFSVDGDHGNAFHVYTGTIDGSGTAANIWVDGTAQSLGAPGVASSSADLDALGFRPFTPSYSDGLLAEILHFNVQLGVLRENVEKYLGDKYGITVAGGTAVDPLTVPGLVGWWKADSL